MQIYPSFWEPGKGPPVSHLLCPVWMIPNVSWLLQRWVAVRNSLSRAPAALLCAVTMLLQQAGDMLLRPARLILCGSMQQPSARGNSCEGWGTLSVWSWWCLRLWRMLVCWALSLKQRDCSLAATCHVTALVGFLCQCSSLSCSCLPGCTMKGTCTDILLLLEWETICSAQPTCFILLQQGK